MPLCCTGKFGLERNRTVDPVRKGWSVSRKGKKNEGRSGREGLGVVQESLDWSETGLWTLECVQKG